MAITLIGEIVNSCDTTGGFNSGNISDDDDFVEGIGAIGFKCSGTLCELFTTTLGASAPYDFSSSGSEFGDHIIMWFNTKTPINATSGIRITVGDSTVTARRAHWNVLPIGFYKGGFITKVIDPERDFDIIETGAFTLTGNPAQLTNIDEMGGTFLTITTIMGNFNNVQIDQITIGTGVRVDAGTGGTPNTFEIVRAADEDTAFWGWWSSTQGAIIGKGKLYIGPLTGDATSVFNDVAFTVIFSSELVAVGFYSFEIRGTATDVDWELASISAADPTVARWSITIESSSAFDDLNGVWSGSDIISLDGNSTLTGTTFINGNVINLLGAVMDGCTVLTPNTADGVAYVFTSNLSNIGDSEFNFSDGHAIQIDTPGAYSFGGNTFVGSYGGATGDNFEPGSTPAGFPIVLDVTETAFTTETTAHAVTMPTTVNPNDILLAVIYTRADTVAANALVTVPTDWVMVQEDTSFANDISQHVLRKVAVGDEDAGTVDFVTDINATMVAQVYRINEAFTDIEVGVAVTGTSTAPDPPSLTPATGTQDYLWIEIVGAIDDVVVTGASTNYGALDTLVSGASGNLRISASSATRDLNASVEDPDAATLASSVFWTANIISIQRSDGGSTDAMIFNDSGGLVTINVSGGGDTPSVRNGINASTAVNNNVELTLTNMKDNTEVRVYTAGTTDELAGIEDATVGTTDNRSFAFSLAASLSVDIHIVNVTHVILRFVSFTMPTVDSSLPISQTIDRTYLNP